MSFNSLLDQLDDYENRNRRQNICICGLREATRAPDLLHTVQGLFCQLLGNAAPADIEIDGVHRGCDLQTA